MCKVSAATIKSIIKLGNGSDDDKWTSSQQMCSKVFPGGVCVDPSVISKLLPTIIKFMNSKAPRVQSEGVFFATVITTTSSSSKTSKQHTQLVIDTGALQNLHKLLTSNDTGVQEMTLRCLGNIATDFPAKIVPYENIIKFVESKNRAVCEEALKTLLTVISTNAPLCQEILENDALKVIKKAFNRIPSIKLLAASFVEMVTSYDDEELVDMVIEEDFIPVILKQINAAVNDDEIKLKFSKIINNIINVKPEIIPSLINEHKIIPIITSALQSDNEFVLIEILTLLDSIINHAGFEMIKQKFKNYGGPRALQRLLQHDDVDIQEISNRINSYVEENIDVKRRVTGSGGRRDIKRDASEIDEEAEEECEAVPPSTTARSRRRRNRSINTSAPTAKKPNTRRERSRVSLDQTDTEPSVSVVDQENDEEDNNMFYDFDYIPSRHLTPIQQQQPQPIVFNLSFEGTPIPPNNEGEEEAEVTEADENDEIPQNAANPNSFQLIEYFNPSEFSISNYCKKQLGLQFCRKDYSNLWGKVDKDFTQITPTSKPATLLPMKDKSGFSCFSVFFTGTEQHAELVWEKINEYFVDNLEGFDKEKIKKVALSRSFMPEHLEVIVRMFHCRIMVYCNGVWEIFGDRNFAENVDIPLFVLQKKESGGKANYEIILSLKN